jgi:sortase A
LLLQRLLTVLAISAALLAFLSACVRSVERDPSPEDPLETPVTEQSDSTACTHPNGAYEPQSSDDASTFGKPVRLLIEAIDVDAEIEYVGLDDEGRMGVPREWENVVWFELGAIPGERGNAVMAGHYDSTTGPAVFYELGELEDGDELIVMTEDDEKLIFEVIEIEDLHVDDLDSSKIFGETEERNLNLVTCSGEWDTSFDMYDGRLVVYTRLVDPGDDDQ